MNLFSGFNPVAAAEYGAEALKEAGIAGYDEIRAGIAFADWGVMEIAAFGLQLASDLASAAATVAAQLARGAAAAAALAARVAAAAERNAQSLAAYAAAEAAIASRDTADAEALSRAYAAQEARILRARLAALKAAAERAAKRAAARVARAVKKAASVVKKAAVVVGKAVYKYSGAQAVVSCATNPNLSSCVQAAVAVAGAVLTVATGGAGAAVDVGLEAAVDAGTDVAVDAAEDGAETAAEHASSEVGATCGGMSFSAGTKVLLANGTTAAISSLKPGEKVLATNTKTGKTQAETVTAVLVHHDTDLYDLKVRVGGKTGKTTVIDTTSSHLFWVPATSGHGGRWLKAGALKYGTHLRAPDGSGTAVVIGGWTPAQHDSWMWDLTVPGDNDHDFYIQTASTGVLVHNCGGGALSSVASSIKGAVGAVGKANPGTLQLGVGAVGGAASSAADSAESGSGWKQLTGNILLGAATGAISNGKVRGGITGSVYLGGATSLVGAVGGQMISNGSADPTKINWGGVTIDTVLGGAENGAGGWIGEQGDNETLGNSMSAFAGLNAGVICGGLDKASKGENC
jgi:hypothetical protein